MGIGFISGLFLIQKNWSSFHVFKNTYFSLCAVLGLFLWVAAHYTFFSLNPVLELSEIRGLWLRTFAGMITATGLGISLSKYPFLRKYFYISLFFVPISNILLYLYASYLQDKFIEPNAYVMFFYAKIETAYFGAISASVAVAYLLRHLVIKNEKISYRGIAFFILGIIVVQISAVLSSTKNGVLVTALLAAFLSGLLFFKVIFFCKKHYVLQGSVVIIIFATLLLTWQFHTQHAAIGWKTLTADVAAGLDVDKNKQWQAAAGEVPLNSLGLSAAGNTYARIAWGKVGLRLIKEFPLGYGSVNASFPNLQDLAKIPHLHKGQTHSGWIDFGLAYGLPGILLLLSSMISTIYLGIRRHEELDLIAAMISLTLLGFCLIAEVSYKQYFEIWIFMITFSATVVALPPFLSRKLGAVR